MHTVQANHDKQVRLCGHTVALSVIAPKSISGVNTFDHDADNLPHSDSLERGGSTNENLVVCDFS